MGTAYGIYSCGSALVMGRIDGETFFGEVVDCLLWGGGGGDEELQGA